MYALRKMSTGTSEIQWDFEKFLFEFSLVKMRTSHTIFYMEGHLFFTCARGHVLRDSQCDSQVKLFFLDLKDLNLWKISQRLGKQNIYFKKASRKTSIQLDDSAVKAFNELIF